jgi:hypothetical protein
MSASTLDYVGSSESENVEAVLAAKPELRSRLGAIEAALVEHFGPGTKVERKVIEDYEDHGDLADEADELYLRVHTDLPIGEKVDRLAEFRHQHQDLLAPARGNLFIGFLG